MEPFSADAITDRDGTLLEERRPQPRDAIRADTAYVMTNLMQGVVQRGTGARPRTSLDWPLAGKTGTVDDYTDAWFVGFDPNITVGVWVGNDEKKPIGPNETGTTAALPMWMDFMKVYIELYGDREHPPASSRPATSSSWRWIEPPASRLPGRRTARSPRPSCQAPNRCASRRPATIADFGSSAIAGLIADCWIFPITR